ncbi:MAG: DUF4363 family protein [Ruminococcaceae bacterium]|nr:DUF4363 family protein [Oscillospiraceae bacterium]
MKNLIIATLLFIILLSATILNAVFITSQAEDLIDMVTEIPSAENASCPISLENFENSWKRFEQIAFFTLSYSELNKINCLIDELHAHLKNYNDADFDHAKAVLINSLTELSRHEKMDFRSIF